MSMRLAEPLFARPPVAQAGAARQWPRLVVLLAAALAAAVLPPSLSVASILGVTAWLVLLGQPFIALCALAFTVPFDTVRSVHAGGLTVTVTNFVVLALALAWLTRGVVVGSIRFGPSPWRTALLLYGAVLLASASQATDLVLSLKELLKWGQLTLVYLAGVSLVRTRRDLRMLMAVLFAAALVEGAADIGQVLLHASPSSFARGGFARAGGTFDQPNPLAGYLNMVLPLAVACLVFNVFDRRLMWVVAIGAGGGVLATLSRGGELGTLAALCTMAAVLSRQARALLIAGAAALALLAGGVAAGIMPSSVTDPFAQGLGIANVDVINPTPQTWNVAERLAHMEAGLGMWADHPILGVGIGNYAAAYDKYRVADVWAANLGHAHNYFINIGAEAGALGEVGWIGLIVSAIVIGARSYRRASDPLTRAAALGGMCVIVGFVVHMFFDDLFVHGLEVQIALVMVLATRAGYGLEPEPGESTPP